ncbi:glutathione S-transferase C-terminal domain-containing protein homolog [Lucilia sericata]|uniref:glutathione S-transferase C-terminal domain-containing protein homolog n=1 Tax=Lucilia sericata TaxID=13632 RepID=UPI0018A857EF|nr:glutathione S-transferase C-terminal domain-containing protein homolog [Lucilia sericata]
MDQLYIEIELSTVKHAETEIFTSVPSFVALYMYRYLDRPENIKLNFVCSTLSTERGKLKLRSESLKRELTEDRILCKDGSKLEAIKDLRLPVYAKEGDTFIAGMCAVCRELIARHPIAAHRKLLGFKESCLLAPSEASIWTRFCEVNIVQLLADLLKSIERSEGYSEMPVECARFERHMNEPVRMHNIYKLAREKANQEVTATSGKVEKKRKNKIKIDCTVPKESLAIDHTFAEGVDFTIADLILYPCMRLIYHCFPQMLQQFPLTNTWLNEIDNLDQCCLQVLNDLCHFPCVDSLVNGLTFKIPDCEASSLYKSDPKRYKPRNRIFTEQTEVENTLSKLETLKINFNSDCAITYGQCLIDWQAIEPAHAESSALPQERLLRKRQQLENLANAVASLAQPGQRIIDFCSGTGHLGILLALKLPQCEIILMENKAISLQRAKQRAQDLKLTNLRFYQCNIDYFEGDFEVGTSLHACGTATDIVLQQCRRSKANFVCCPCCYGSLQPMPHIKYPLSEKFRQVLSEKDFMYIAHTADQAHAMGTLNCRPETTLQGQLCMDIVDTDRKLQAEEAGYKVLLTRLKPEDCTPKNRLLVGRLRQESNTNDIRIKAL